MTNLAPNSARFHPATRLRSLLGPSAPERITDGVHLIRGGFLNTMNVYLLEDAGGVTVFDAGTADMTDAVLDAATRLGGIKRVVLSHADVDHRGTAPALGAPVYCHPAERPAAESDAHVREYHDPSKLAPHGRLLLTRLITKWDGGAVQIADTINEGDDIAGFTVIHLPGHAPGLIGLYRESYRLALVSDTFYTLDPQTGIRRAPRIPHPAFNQNTNQARASIRKLAELEPSAAWPGHAKPITHNVRPTLQRAARHRNG